MSKPCKNCGDWIDGNEGEMPLTCGDTRQCINALKVQNKRADERADEALLKHQHALTVLHDIIAGKKNEIIYLGEKVDLYRKEAHDAIHEKETFKESVRGLLEAEK